jgi:hypothetical protein
MKLALAVFHFNPHWGADPRIANRHCTEALGPFLLALHQNPWWRVNIEMSGSGLEFYQRTFPDQFKVLRILVDRGQVELISSLYTPNIWIAFPRCDLERSIDLNRASLSRLGIPWTRLFFAQECFFGMGVGVLKEHFDAAICKDDYLLYYYDIEWNELHYSVGGMRTVIASGHLLREMASRIREHPNSVSEYGLSYAHERHISQLRELNNDVNFPARRQRHGDLECYWYHCGDGHHFGCTAKPDVLEQSYYDLRWSGAVTRLVRSLRDEQGYEMSTIGDFLRESKDVCPCELPPLPEGGWNPRAAEGIWCWMGRNSSVTEDDSAVLSSIARARRRLLWAERACGASVVTADRNKVLQLWSSLLHAQISDTLGWYANANAVSFAIGTCDHVLISSTQLLESRGEEYDHEYPTSPQITLADRGDLPQVVIFGAEGSVGYSTYCDNVVACDCVFQVTESLCGIHAHFGLDRLVFCPSGMETLPAEIPLNDIKAEIVTLPLANGLLKISEKWFLIKDTSYLHLAARIIRGQERVEFCISGASIGRRYHWRLLVANLDLMSAIALANRLNSTQMQIEWYPAAAADRMEADSL